MMKLLKWFRRRIILAGGLIAIFCFVLLMNITAPNPTGRRYSQQIPLSTGDGTIQAIGLDGEAVLAHDLRIARNEDADQRQCICNGVYLPRANECRSCVVTVQSVVSYRRPDFVTPTFIAEAKNRREMLAADTELLAQIRDYAAGAQALGQPLWLFVRVNTLLDPQYTRLVEATGGGVVYYFAVEGYVDPVDYWVSRILLSVMLLLILLLVWEAMTLYPRHTVFPTAPPEKTSVPDVISRAERAVRNAEDHQSRRKQDIHSDLDKPIL